MAAKKLNSTDSKDGTSPDDKGQKLSRELSNAKNAMTSFRSRWEDFLDIAYARLSTDNGFRSRVREGSLSSILWERAARVVAQMPTGRIQALTTKDEGKSKLMDLVWNKYVIPGANTDYSFFTKLRMWDYYSFVYGAAPAFYDYRIDDEYTGPDWTILDPRYVFPQAGRLSAQRCDYIFVVAHHGKSYLESKKDLDGWNAENIDKIISDLSDTYQPDTTKLKSNLQTERGSSELHEGEIELVTKYQRGTCKNDKHGENCTKGHWITFAPGHDNLVVRDIPNPHKSGRLPIVFKYCFPLLDSLWGMGDVERGESLQKAVDTSVNLSLDFAKFKLYPPMYYTDGVNASQLRYEPGAKWKLPNQNAAGFMGISGSYSQEFQTMYQFLKGALLNQNGTTDTTISATDKMPGYGKTPAAQQALEARENSRDNWDRNMLEEAYEELANGMISLIGEKQPKAIDFHIFDEEIQKIMDAGAEDVMEIFDSAKKHYVTDDGQLAWDLNGKGAAKLTIAPSDLKGAYRYMMDAGTTMATDDAKEHQRLTEIMTVMGTPAGQMLQQAIQQDGRQLSMSELFKRWLISSGTEDWEKILPEQTDQQSQAQQFDPSMLQNPQLQQMAQQMQPQGQPMPPQMPPQMPQPMAPNPMGAM